METIQGLTIHGPAIVGTGVVFTILTVVAVALRFTSKRITAVGFGADDWLLLASLVLYVVAEVLVIRSDLVGRKALSPEDDRYQTYLKYVYIYSIFYFPIIALVQASVLFLYRRLFYPSHLRYTSLLLSAIVFSWCVAALVIEIGYAGHTIQYFFPDNPTTTVWNVTYLSFWFAMSIIEALLEIMILLLPLREIPRLQLSTHKKCLLSLIFGLGGFVVITAIIRMAILYRPNQPNIDLTQGDIWLNVHLGTGILSACLPTFRPLVLRVSGFLQSFQSQRKGSAYPTERGSVLSRVRRNEGSREGIVMEPQKEGQGIFSDARWSDESNTPSGLEEDRAVRAGEGIGVRKTVELMV